MHVVAASVACGHCGTFGGSFCCCVLSVCARQKCLPSLDHSHLSSSVFCPVSNLHRPLLRILAPNAFLTLAFHP